MKISGLPYPADVRKNKHMGFYEVTVSARFVARHSVALPDGSAEVPHEHEWCVTAAFRADRLDENGFVIDFTAVQAVLAEIAGELEGKNLNDSPLCADGGAATAERLAEGLAGWLAQRSGRDVHCLRVTEAPGCDAAFYPARQ